MLRLIILIIITIAVLSYFGFNLREFFESGIVRGNYGYVWNWMIHMWDTYLERPAKYLWNDVFIDLIWDSFIENLKRFKQGIGPGFENPEIPR